MKFYLPAEPVKWGFKLHCLCESENGVCLKVELDQGKQYKKSKGYTCDLVLGLVEEYKNEGYYLYFDSWYSSPELIMKLKEIGIASTGAVKRTRKELPSIDNEGETSQKATTGTMNFIDFKDKRVIHCITSIFDDTLVTTHRRSGSIDRPEAII